MAAWSMYRRMNPSVAVERAIDNVERLEGQGRCFKSVRDVLVYVVLVFAHSALGEPPSAGEVEALVATLTKERRLELSGWVLSANLSASWVADINAARAV